MFLELNEPARACTQCKLGLKVTGEHPKEILAKLYFRFVMVIHSCCLRIVLRNAIHHKYLTFLKLIT